MLKETMGSPLAFEHRRRELEIEREMEIGSDKQPGPDSSPSGRGSSPSGLGSSQSGRGSSQPAEESGPVSSQSGPAVALSGPGSSLPAHISSQTGPGSSQPGDKSGPVSSPSGSSVSVARMGGAAGEGGRGGGTTGVSDDEVLASYEESVLLPHGLMRRYLESASLAVRGLLQSVFFLCVALCQLDHHSVFNLPRLSGTSTAWLRLSTSGGARTLYFQKIGA